MHSRLFWPARACPAWAVNGPAGPDYEPVSSHSADVSLVSVFRSWTAKTGQWRWTTEESGEHVTVHSRKIKTRRRSTRKEQLTSHRLKERRTRPSSWYHRPPARPADRPSNLPDPPTGPNCESADTPDSLVSIFRARSWTVKKRRWRTFRRINEAVP